MTAPGHPGPLDLPPGRERRTLMRKLKMQVGIDDFSAEEWIEIEAEAPGMRAAIEAEFGDAAFS